MKDKLKTGSELGKILINSKEHKEVANAIRKIIKGKTITIKLCEETKQKIQELNAAKKN